MKNIQEGVGEKCNEGRGRDCENEIERKDIGHQDVNVQVEQKGIGMAIRFQGVKEKLWRKETEYEPYFQKHQQKGNRILARENKNIKLLFVRKFRENIYHTC